MAKQRLIVVVDVDVDDDSFGEHTDRQTDKWARSTEEDFRDDPGLLFEALDNAFENHSFTVNVAPLD